MKHLLLIILLLSSSLAFAQENTYTNSVGIEFIRVEPGTVTIGKFQPPYPVPADTVKNAKHARTMWMGDGRGYSAEDFANAKKLAEKDAMPGFTVAIERPFYLGKFEVTQKQWKAVMGKNPSVFQYDTLGKTDNLPVENVTFKDVQEFLTRLNKLDPDRRYRLPTEFEWEYAARAGREGDIPWNEITASAHLGQMSTKPVGTKAPNAWGFHDMLGNVWEWVSDYYNEKIFADPVPPSDGKQHVLKGASIAGDVKNATYKTHAAGPGNGWDVGFRIVMEINR